MRKLGTARARGLTIRQPWASLVACGAKKVETRSWSTKYRGWVAIHASARFGPEERAQLEQQAFRSAIRRLNGALPLGCVIATCEIIDVVSTTVLRNRLGKTELALGNYANGRFGWILGNVRRLRKPVPMPGALGLWKLPRGLHAPK